MATYATLTVPVLDIIGANFNESRASVWIEPNVPVVLADGIRVGGRREQVVNGVATFANLVTTNSATNPASFGYRVTITAPPKGAQKREDIVVLTTSDFPFTGATANLKDIPEAWDDIAIPADWRSEFMTQAQALLDQQQSIADIDTPDALVKTLVETPTSETAGALSATFAALDGTDRTYTPAPGKTNGWEAIWNAAAGYLIHARAGAASTADNAVIGVGTDKGAGNGILVSHKNDGSGIRLIHNPSGALGQYVSAYSTNPAMFFDQYVGAGPSVVVKYRTGQGFKDGATIAGKTTIASALAVFAGGDVGAGIGQLTTRSLSDPTGSIPDGATLTAVVDTTVAAGSNGAALPQATISLASVTGIPTGGGIIAITSSAGVQFVTYTGVSGSTITGCSGGTGNLATGNAARLGVMSAPAGFTATGINFRVTGRAVDASKRVVEVRDSDDSVLFALSKGSYFQWKPSDATTPSFIVKGKNGQTGDIFQAINFSAGTVALRAGENGAGGDMSASFSNAGNTARRALLLTNFAAGQEGLRIKHGHATPTADLLVVVDNNDTLLSRFNKAGYFMTRKTAAPADADLGSGEMSLWLDSTNGAAKLMVKAKQADGTVRTASVALA